jgi:tetratricopeptide (TPR) repeat protein
MNHSKKLSSPNKQYKLLVTIKEADLIVEADSENLLRLLGIDLPKLKITNSVEQRSHYRAISNWLTKFKTPSNASNLDRVKGYLNAFDHLCKLKEWNKAVIVIASHIDSPLKERLFEELQGWGEYNIVISICNQLLGKVSEDFDCYLYNQMGMAYQRIGLYREAIDFFKKSLDISSEFEDILIQGEALGHIGDTYRLIGEIDKATNYIEKSWEILKHSDKRGKCPRG